MLIRKGAADVFGRFGTARVNAGDLVLVVPGVISIREIAPLDVLAAEYHPQFVLEQMRWSRPPHSRVDRALLDEIKEWTGGARAVSLEVDRYMEFQCLLEDLYRASIGDVLVPSVVPTATELVWKVRELIVDPLGTAHESWTRRNSLVRAEVVEGQRRLREGYADGVTVEEVARSVALSQTAFRRAFKENIGVTPREYLHGVRMLAFENLVSHTNLSIAEAARQVGWSATSHVRRAFRRKYGVSPRDYRAKLRERLTLANRRSH